MCIAALLGCCYREEAKLLSNVMQCSCVVLLSMVMVLG